MEWANISHTKKHITHNFKMKEEREKILVLVRGIPGAGKTTFAEKLAWPLGAPVYSADDYFMKDGKYIFNVAGLGAAHAQCLERI